MKKIILTAVLIIAFAVNLSAQVKVNYYLTNARLSGTTIWLIDLYATVPAGQTWNVGPTCLRMNYNTVPAGDLTLTESNPVDNANANLSGNTNYAPMTTTSIMGGQAVSLNILPLYGQPYYALVAGSYLLGTLKFNILDPGTCINMSFIITSAIFDQMTPLAYSSGWTKVDPPPCITEVQAENTLVPDKYTLSQNYPNPFNPTTSIKFGIPANSFVRISVFDVVGREVCLLVNEDKPAGNYIVDFDASQLSSGVYYYRLETKDFVEVKKMMLIK